MADIPTIAVWFSCGAASAVAAKKTLERYNNYNIRIINNYIAEEDIDNRRFLKDVEKWLGVKIEQAINPEYPMASAVGVWQKRKYMSGVLGAPCTEELKKEARYIWEAANDFDYMVLGFTADEKARHDDFVLGERDNVLPVLIDAGITKKDCYTIIREAGILLPRIYEMGVS